MLLDSLSNLTGCLSLTGIPVISGLSVYDTDNGKIKPSGVTTTGIITTFVSTSNKKQYDHFNETLRRYDDARVVQMYISSVSYDEQNNNKNNVELIFLRMFSDYNKEILEDKELLNIYVQYLQLYNMMNKIN